MNIPNADRFSDWQFAARPTATGFDLFGHGLRFGTATVAGDAITITLGDIAGVVALDGTVRSASNPKTKRPLKINDLRANLLVRAAHAVEVALAVEAAR